MKTASQSNVRHGSVKRYVEAEDMIVVMEVPVIYASESPDEPLMQAKTIKLLDEAQRRADAGDVAWLRKHGRVYRSVPA